MCKASTEPGGPYRCSGDMRDRVAVAQRKVAAAEQAVQRATATLGATPWCPESQGGHSEYGIADPNYIQQLSDLHAARQQLARTQKELSEAQAAYRAIPDDIADLLRHLEKAVVAGTDRRTVRLLQHQHI